MLRSRVACRVSHLAAVFAAVITVVACAGGPEADGVAAPAAVGTVVQEPESQPGEGAEAGYPHTARPSRSYRVVGSLLDHVEQIAAGVDEPLRFEPQFVLLAARQPVQVPLALDRYPTTISDPGALPAGLFSSAEPDPVASLSVGMVHGFEIILLWPDEEARGLRESYTIGAEILLYGSVTGLDYNEGMAWFVVDAYAISE